MMILNQLKTVVSFAGGAGAQKSGAGLRTGAGSGPGASEGTKDPALGALPGITLSDELVEDIKKNVETSQDLQRSMESAKDGARRDKVARLQEKIEQLKERIRFATPQQAKALMKELKQLAREFKGAAKDLGSDARSVSGASTSSLASLSAGATSTASSSATDASLLEATLNAGTNPVTGADKADQAAPKETSTGDGTAGTGEKDDAAAQTSSAEKQQELRKAVMSYVSEQVREEIGVAAGRAEGMKLEREQLKKIGKDLKFIAGQIEMLHKLGRDDKDEQKIRRDQKGVLDAVKDGMEEVNDPQAIRSINAAVAAYEAIGGDTSQDDDDSAVSGSQSPQAGSLAYSAQIPVAAPLPAADFLT